MLVFFDNQVNAHLLKVLNLSPGLVYLFYFVYITHPALCLFTYIIQLFQMTLKVKAMTYVCSGS